MARIVIDCRLWGIKHTGLGRYTENLVTQILKKDHVNEYILLTRTQDTALISKTFPNVKVIEAEARHYTIKEQLLLPVILFRLKPDLVHIPHFNIPVAWPGKIVVTIHDLITHKFHGINQTTLQPYVYWPKYAVHRLVFWLSIWRASKIIVPTNWAKRELVNAYGVTPGKVLVTPEAVSPIYFANAKGENIPRKFGLQEQYLVYTGNIYEHKNLKRLVMAVVSTDTKLLIVCSRSVFLERFENEIKKLGASHLVTFLGNVTDAHLRDLYRGSLALVTPSLSEGFGLTGLEAMGAGTIVLSSSASCLPEVYKNFAIYFDPLDIKDIAQKIRIAMTMPEKTRRTMISQGVKYAGGFSWEETAKRTLKIYEKALRS